MSIGERISELRTEQNISQYQLSQQLGVSRQAVSKWENDQTSPDTLNLIKLADLLDTDVEYLATGRHIPLPPSPPAEIKYIEKTVEVEKVVEVEKLIEVEKPVEVRKIVERVVEKPVIHKVSRTKYLRNPIEFLLVGVAGFIAGLLIGLIF